jgi:hypothetical protein
MQLSTQRALIRITSIPGALLAASTLLTAQGPLPGDAPTTKEIADAGKLFRSSCTSCHLPPDPDHATDLAWLDQVTDTA